MHAFDHGVGRRHLYAAYAPCGGVVAYTQHNLYPLRTIEASRAHARRKAFNQGYLADITYGHHVRIIAKEKKRARPAFFGLYLLRLKVLYVVIKTVNNGLRLASLAKVLG